MSISTSPPSIFSCTSLPRSRARSRTSRGNFAEQIADRLHAGLRHDLLQFGGDQADALRSVADAAFVLARQRFVQLVAAEHQLAGQGHQGFEQGHIEPDGGLDGRRGATGAAEGAAATPRMTGSTGEAIGKGAAGAATGSTTGWATWALRRHWRRGRHLSPGRPGQTPERAVLLEHVHPLRRHSTACPIRSGSSTVAYSTLQQQCVGRLVIQRSGRFQIESRLENRPAIHQAS